MSIVVFRSTIVQIHTQDYLILVLDTDGCILSASTLPDCVKDRIGYAIGDIKVDFDPSEARSYYAMGKKRYMVGTVNKVISKISGYSLDSAFAKSTITHEAFGNLIESAMRNEESSEIIQQFRERIIDGHRVKTDMILFHMVNYGICVDRILLPNMKSVAVGSSQNLYDCVASQ